MGRYYLPHSLKKRVGGGYGAPLKPCAICGSFYKTCVDHIIPLALGGTDEEGNLQVLCEPCNLRKGGRWTNDQLVAWYLREKDAIEKHRRRHYGRKYEAACA